MKKRIIVFSLILAIILTGLPLSECEGILAPSAQAAETKFSGGDGTATNPYQIANADDLKKLSDDVYLGNDYSENYFCLTDDIDLSKYSDGEGWKPIGGVGKYDTEIFKGNFDGQNHIIRNLVINRPDEDYCGLFGYVDTYIGLTPNGYIKNIKIENCNIVGANYVGALAGWSDNVSLIANCFVTGYVQGTYSVGGVVGYTRSSKTSIIQNIYTNVEITGAATKDNMAKVGGIAGHSDIDIIRDCFVTGAISACSEDTNKSVRAGGIVGFNSHTKVVGCVVLAEITKNSNSSGYASGICGQMINVDGDSVIFCEFLGKMNYSVGQGNYIYSMTNLADERCKVKFCLSNGEANEKEQNNDIFTECYFADDAKSEENLAKMKTFVDEYNTYLREKGEETYDYEYVADRYNEYNGYPILNTFAKYDVSFYDGETLIDKQAVMYGKDASAPALEKECMELSWDSSFCDITRDIDLHAVWTEKHDYGTPVFEWSADGSECQIKFTCKNNAEHTKIGDCTITSAVKTPATCTEMGVTTYTATYQNGKTQHLDTLDVKDIAIDANNHDYETPTFEWSEDGKSCQIVFTCKNDSSHIEQKDCTVTSAVKTPATYEQMGVTSYTAEYKNGNATYTDTKYVTDIPKVTKEPEQPKATPNPTPDVITDTNNNASYKVTKLTTLGGTVQYTAPADKKAKAVVIPDIVTADGVTYKVTSIAKNAFAGYTDITSVKIGNNITSIPANAFEGCKKLKSVTIGKNVTTIGDKAFYKCTAITKITIPSKVKKIGKSAFDGCKKLKKITMTAGKLKTIGKIAFKGIHKKAAFKVNGAKKAKSALKKKLKVKKIGYVKTWKIK